ncbi:septum formation family protein [Rhodococcus chondri]|uniref:Septum formation family protein n=1 Tax=Rhodococcus chondri TaxID=3065941 RepID=A0ABU7JL36_9NOCA|nr:septum formation family protein [Rhodococcus sp. CC-R104]MEE2030756.1 septum formation family protein [Rhodococcus sp. CC-R104]
MAEDKKQRSVRRPPSARLTRRALVLVAAGAVLAAIATFVVAGFQGADGGGTDAGNSISTTGAVAGEAFGTSTAGDCLTWTELDASDLTKVDCEQTHLFEVVADIDLSVFPGTEWGPGSRFPSVLRFTELREEQCTPDAMDYLNGRFDPSGKFSVGLINPGEAGWAAGERTLRCGLQFSSTTGNLLPIKGKVADQDQSRAWEAGVCIGINNGVPADPVECTKPHAFEVVSVVDLSSQFPEGLPSIEDQDRYLEQTCTETVNQYLGDPDGLRNKTLTLFWDNLNFGSWLAGSRKVNCSVGKQVEGGGFASITGSAKGDILIDGQPPVPPPPVPEGRSLPAPLPGAVPLPGS